MENKIEIHNMNLHYGDFHALHDINLDIKENEITAFIGPSGCGKSTLLRSLNRMNDLVENCRITGDIMLDGQDIYKNCDVNLLRAVSAWYSRSRIRSRCRFMITSPMVRARTASRAVCSLTRSSRLRSSVPHIWEETKDNLKKIRAVHVRQVSSSVSASRVRLPQTRRCC